VSVGEEYHGGVAVSPAAGLAGGAHQALDLVSGEVFPTNSRYFRPTREEKWSAASSSASSYSAVGAVEPQLGKE